MKIIPPLHSTFFYSSNGTTTSFVMADAIITTPQTVLYCDACGMPPEYCSYGPDFETHWKVSVSILSYAFVCSI